MPKTNVILATEGTYPFSGGGVSTWCHHLCGGLEGVRFSVLAVTGDANVTWQYPRAAAVRSVVHVPLWPGEEPAAFLSPGRYSDTLRRRWATTDAAVTEGFVPPLRVLLREIFLGSVDREELITAFVAMALHLRRHDYKETMRAAPTWAVFQEAVSEFAKTEAAARQTATLSDATTCARWFYAMMMPIAIALPPCDLYHATTAASCALPGIVARRLEGTPLLLTEHGVYLRERYIAISKSAYSQAQKRFLVGLALAIGRASYAAADVIAPVAAYNQRWEIPWGAPKERLRVIYNGVDTSRFKPGPSRKEEPSRPVAVAAARVFPLKDIETLVRATAVARARLPSLRVLVYGSLLADPEYVARCRALASELSLGDNFQLKGFHACPSELYLEGDISVLSSISEGFPYTVIESMACAIPCVATDVGGVREAVGDAGIVVPARDPEAFGNAMVDLLTSDDGRQAMGARGRQRVVDHFTIEAQLHAYANLYEELREPR